MGGIHNDKLEMRDVVWAKVCKAVYSGHAIETGEVAKRLSVSYPNCGMTRREIEDEIIRLVGLAGGAAEIGQEKGARTG